MSTWSKIKLLLGFGDIDPESYDEYDISQDFASSDSMEDAEALVAPEVQAEKVQEIFDSVVSVFTAALPDFISSSIDPAKMSQQLYDRLDESSKIYLKGLENDVKQYYHTQWTIERKRLEDEAAALRQKAQDLQEKQTALNDSKLSAERQKRALGQRVIDLEQQIQRIEAEKEQLDLENKCMINKAKAAAVMEKELEDLRANMSPSAAAAMANNTANQELTNQIENLKAELEEKSSLIEKKNSELAEKASLLEEKTSELEEKSKQVERQEEVLAQKDSMLSDKDRLLAEKDELLSKKDELLAEKESAIVDQDETQREIEEIKQQVEKFEEMREKMNARYEKLRETLTGVQNENESLRQTIRNNLLQSAEEQKILRERITELKQASEVNAGASDNIATGTPAEVYAASPESAKPIRKRKAAKLDVDDLDEIMLETDWMVSAPPTDTSMRSDQPNPDFGYQPPQRSKSKQSVHSAQPSLFNEF